MVQIVVNTNNWELNFGEMCAIVDAAYEWFHKEEDYNALEKSQPPEAETGLLKRGIAADNAMRKLYSVIFKATYPEDENDIVMTPKEVNDGTG
jgi:hypothetical protein